MNFAPANPRRIRASSLRPDWPAQLEAWRALIAECNTKPTRKRVHLLRVATLRLQAQIGYWLEHHDSDHPAAPVARRWNKLAKHLRRALGAVRSFDVHLANLAKVRAMLTASSGYEPRSSRASLRQIEALERRFKRNRKAAAKDLTEALATRNYRLQQAIADMILAPALQRILVPAIATSRLSEMLGTIVTAFPRLDAKSLHDFRKQLKSVRYIAEVAASSASARELAAAVKAMQGAIGAWHDWEELAAEAKRAFRGEEDLAELLETIARESLEKALAFCKSATAQSVPTGPESCSPPTLPRPHIPDGHEVSSPDPSRKPVLSVTPAMARRRFA